MRLRKVNSNADLYSEPATNWRDTFGCMMIPNPPRLDELPPPCREILPEYTSQLMKLGKVLFGLLSESLGLQQTHLYDMGCSEGLNVSDQIGGLQVLHRDHWIDVPPTPGALVINIGDHLQNIEVVEKVNLDNDGDCCLDDDELGDDDVEFELTPEEFEASWMGVMEEYKLKEKECYSWLE
uniref:Isopenicillin N synthase-like Fe(2+) 2OG dioxygenase domain-containing protein n=1 Tax=Chenopodium quinoa TaxID=63459 RepID=A0A803MYI5_CHEQI